MTATITGDIDGDDWVMRYRLPIGHPMERRPIASSPHKEGIYWVDFGSALHPGPSSAALWLNGQWCKTNRQPFRAGVTHWSKMVGEND